MGKESTDGGVNPIEGVGRAVLIEVLRKARADTCARARYGALASRGSHFACSISLPSDAAPFRIPDHHGGDGFCPEKYNIFYHGVR